MQYSKIYFLKQTYTLLYISPPLYCRLSCNLLLSISYSKPTLSSMFLYLYTVLSHAIFCHLFFTPNLHSPLHSSTSSLFSLSCNILSFIFYTNLHSPFHSLTTSLFSLSCNILSFVSLHSSSPLRLMLARARSGCLAEGNMIHVAHLYCHVAYSCFFWKYTESQSYNGAKNVPWNRITLKIIWTIRYFATNIFVQVNFHAAFAVYELVK